MRMKRRAAVAAFACAAVGIAAGVHAQTPQVAGKLAILSLIGDAITINEYVGQTGTNVDSLKRQTVPIPDAVFDRAALLSAQDALKKLNPGAQIATLAPPKAGSDSDPAKLIVDGRVDATNPLVAALRKEGYGQLVVVSKLRAPAQMRLRSESVGHGHVTGLGFYVDKYFEIKKVATGETVRGFIAPYAYLKLSLVDLESLAVVRVKDIPQDRIEGDFRGKSGISPWDALTAEEKTRILRELIMKSVADAIPGLVDATTKQQAPATPALQPG